MRKLLIGTVLAVSLAMPALAGTEEDTRANWNDCDMAVWKWAIDIRIQYTPTGKEIDDRRVACQKTYPKGYAEWRAEPAPSELATLLREQREEYRSEVESINRNYRLRRAGVLPY